MRILAFAIALFVSGSAFSEALVPLTSHTVATSTTEATSPNLNSGAIIVRLLCTADCFIAISHGATTSATSVPVYLPLDKPELFRISPGNTIIVIRDTGDGSLHITEMSR